MFKKNLISSSVSCGKNKLERFEASGLHYKSFRIVINDRNDSSHYYNAMITIVSYAQNLT